MDAVLRAKLEEAIAALENDDDGLLLSPERVALLERVIALRDDRIITPAEYDELKTAMF